MATTGFILPSTNQDDFTVHNAFNDPANVYTSGDAAWAWPDGTAAAWFYGGFDFATAGLSSGNTINGIEIRARSLDTFNDETWAWQVAFGAQVGISPHNVVADYGTPIRLPSAGNAYTSSSFDNFTIGGASDLLGFSGDADDLLDTEFWLMIQWLDSGATKSEVHLASLWMNIHYTAAGGVTITDVDTDETWTDGDTGLIITGTGFV